MKKFLPVILLPIALIVARCGAPPPASDVTTLGGDVYKCVIGIIATAGGSIDVNGLLACGLSVADALTLLQDLRTKATPEAGAAIAPERVVYIQKLDKAIAELKSRQ